MTTATDFSLFKEDFFKNFGLKLDNYKERQLERRIRQLIDREKIGSFDALIGKLKKEDQFLNDFFCYLTINTSEFFRDPRIYDYLRQQALIDLLGRNQKVNIWSMGCSRGEEPYTLAILLSELKALNRATILASDFDDKARAEAKKGYYSKHQLEKMPTEILSNYFDQTGGGYQIKGKIRDSVKFEKHNFLENIYRGLPQMHLVLCRNVFIYFKLEVQEWIVEQLSKVIAPDGYFIIGCSEFIGKPEQHGLIKIKPSIYQKVA